MSGSVVVALDKFRGSLTAVQACAALAEGLRAAHPDRDVVPLPVADGGEGTVDAVVAAGWSAVVRRVSGPTGEPVDATFAPASRESQTPAPDVRGEAPADATFAPVSGPKPASGPKQAAEAAPARPRCVVCRAWLHPKVAWPDGAGGWLCPRHARK